MKASHQIQKKKLLIKYEDQSIIVVFKPPGQLVQADKTNDPDVISLVRKHLEKRFKIKHPFVGLVHRLDRPASGIVILAKTRVSSEALTKQFRNRTVKKEYLAIVHGHLPNKGHMRDLLIKNPDKGLSRIAENCEDKSKIAELEFNCLGTRCNRSLAQINLITGRHHQIRVQFASRGFPIVGDRKYGSREVLRNPGMIALLAFKIRIAHPKSQKSIMFRSQKPLHWPWHGPMPS